MEPYIELKKQVGEALQSQAAQRNKAILTLAAGALALSLTFLKDIAPTPDDRAITLLAWSWVCFIISMCLTLISFQVSVCAFRRFDEILNIQQAESGTDASTLKNCWVTVTLILNRLSLVMFIAGAILLLVAAHHGLKMKERNVSGKEKIERLTEGAVPVSPPVAAKPPVIPPKPGKGAIPTSPPVRPPKAPAPPPAQPPAPHKKGGG